MDEALAAIVGAGVGAIGATFAAVWAGHQSKWQTKTQMRGQHLQWRRESRRTAFADVIRACGDLQHFCKETVAATLETPRDDEAVAQHMAAVEQRLAVLQTARIVADLEAPTLDETLTALEASHTEMVNQVRDVVRGNTHWGEAASAGGAASTSTGHFVAKAQKELNSYEGAT
ncbi:hypothetical protein [Streptomyces sp. NPDC002205]|uniref:hypothetical protein n=1 Tax=Streptomyces sp. NPDC002205 TaxID=3154411 RepID=UPI0033253E92